MPLEDIPRRVVREELARSRIPDPLGASDSDVLHAVLHIVADIGVYLTGKEPSLRFAVPGTDGPLWVKPGGVAEWVRADWLPEPTPAAASGS